MMLEVRNLTAGYGKKQSCMMFPFPWNRGP